jgi:hypothetical protein
MRITSGGNVAIGGTSAPAPLTVYGAAGNVLDIEGTTTGNTQLQIGAPNLSGANARLYLQSAGVVGGTIEIDRASVAMKIWVGGGSAGVTLSSGGNSWGSFSDERLKTDLIPIDDGLNKILMLRALTGRFKTDEEGKSRSFLIAQDVQKVLPEAVYDDKSEDKILSLQYTDVIPLLVKAIQESHQIQLEQQATITSLQDRIYKLENK